MKKLISLILVLVMVTSVMAGCGAKESTKVLEGTMEENINKIAEKVPVEFMSGVKTVDLADTSEEGLWAVTYNTGLENGDKLSDLAVFEPMMGSMAFSLVMARVKNAADAQAVAEEMSEKIDTRKWICVEADQKMVATYGDVVMLIMLDSSLELTTQSYVDAFKTVCGGELDFTA